MVISSPKQLGLIAADQRKKLKLTQLEVADRVGLKQKTVSAFENNPDRVMFSTAFAILSALDLDIKVFSKSDNSESTKWLEEW